MKAVCPLSHLFTAKQ